MMEFITQGGVFMIPIIFSGVIIILVSMERVYALYLKRDLDKASLWRRLPALKFLGIGCTLMGVLGSLMGIYQAFSSERLITAGMPVYDVVRIALSTSIMGMTISCISLLAYSLLSSRARHLRT